VIRQILRSAAAVLVAVLLIVLVPAGGAKADSPAPVTVYYNRACGDCLQYIEETVVPLLEQGDYTNITYKDYVNEPDNRKALLARSEALGVPPDLQSHLTVFVGDRLVLEGHIPSHVIGDLLTAPRDAFERMVVYQDKMSGATDYAAWAVSGETRTYPIDAPIGRYLDYLEQHGEQLSARVPAAVEREGNLLPLVLVTGFLDGLNPCAFAVLLFFIAFLFTIRRTTASMWAMGTIYIAAIYLAYFLIGLGLMQAAVFTNRHHLMARIGAWLVIGLGLINVKDYVFPQLPIHLRIPTIAHGPIQDWLKRATFPTAAVGGFLLGYAPSPALAASTSPSSGCWRPDPPTCGASATWGSTTWPSSRRCWSPWWPWRTGACSTKFG
jgi:cytochrome c biogenesis protein CcdA